jgi:hypothetical protein
MGFGYDETKYSARPSSVVPVERSTATVISPSIRSASVNCNDFPVALFGREP